MVELFLAFSEMVPSFLILCSKTRHENVPDSTLASPNDTGFNFANFWFDLKIFLCLLATEFDNRASSDSLKALSNFSILKQLHEKINEVLNNAAQILRIFKS